MLQVRTLREQLSATEAARTEEGANLKASHAAEVGAAGCGWVGNDL